MKYFSAFCHLLLQIMDDIEDLIQAGTANDDNQRVSAHKTMIFPKKKDMKSDEKNVVASSSITINKDDKSFKSSTSSCVSSCSKSNSEGVPGTQKIYVKTYGCSHNISDGEYMQGILQSYGYEIVDDLKDADLSLVNSCTVKDPSQAQFLNLVKKSKEDHNIPVVVAGCVPQADKKIKELEDVSVVGIQQIDRVVEVVEETLKGNSVKLLTKKSLPALDLPKVRKNPLIEIIPLSTGCLGSCTYCKTKHARGVLGSYDPNELISRVKMVVAEGVQEIWLTSEDTGAYGLDIGTNIAELLTSIIDNLPNEGVMLRVGMTNPPYILKHIDEVAKLLNDPRVFSFLHIPVQAGSNRVLEAMRREYTVEDFKTVANSLIRHVPDVIVATDIICGFPTETEEDFDETMNLMQEYKLAITNISQFYPRPGTPAARMKRIKTQIVKERSRKISSLFNSFTPYEKYVGRTERVWFGMEVTDQVSEKGQQGRSVGHTKSYVKVIVDYDATLPGTDHLVTITSCKRFHIEGTIIPNTRKGFSLEERRKRAAVLVPQVEKYQRPTPIKGSSKYGGTRSGSKSSKSSNKNKTSSSSSGSSNDNGVVNVICCRLHKMWSSLIEKPVSLNLDLSIQLAPLLGLPFPVTVSQYVCLTTASLVAAKIKCKRKGKEDVNTVTTNSTTSHVMNLITNVITYSRAAVVVGLGTHILFTLVRRVITQKK